MNRNNIRRGLLSVRDLVDNYVGEDDDEKIFFDMNSQREESQWSSEWKSDLIHSVLQGYYIPEVHIVKTGTRHIKEMSVFEGKQRLTTIIEYVLGLFPLAKTTMPVKLKTYMLDEHGNCVYDESNNKVFVEEEYDIAGKKYADLPKRIQNKLIRFELTTVMYFDFNDEQIAIQMERLNRQKRFNGTQTAKVKIGELKASYINNITKNDFFDNRIFLTSAKKKADELSKIVFQSLMVYTGNVTALNNGNIEKFAKNHPEQFDKSVLNKINDILSDLDTLIPNNEEVNKSLTSVNIPILVFNYDKYEQMLENEEITRDEYKEFLKYWFKKGIFSPRYTQYIGGTPTNKTYVEGRINIIEEELIKFIAGIRDAESIESETEDSQREESLVDGNVMEGVPANNADVRITYTDKAASENINVPIIKKEKNNFIEDYLRLKSGNVSEETALKALRAVMAAKGYIINNADNKENLINYLNTFSNSRQKEFIKQSEELISKIDFKNIDSVVAAQVVKLYECIKSNDIKSKNEIKFNKWLSGLHNDRKYKEMISELDYSEGKQEQGYKYLYDAFLRYSVLQGAE